MKNPLPFLRQYATWLLSAAAAASLALAFIGENRASAAMSEPFAQGMVASLVFASAVAAVCPLLLRLRSPLKTDFGALFMHAGFALVLLGWIAGRLFSPPDEYLRVPEGRYAYFGINPVQSSLPAWNLVLDAFRIERWPDTGEVRQYESSVRIAPYDDAPLARHVISVNHPLALGGYRVYQNSFEFVQNPHTGGASAVSVLKVSHDCGLPLARLGGILLLAGAFIFALRDVFAVRGRTVRPPPSRPRADKLCRMLYAAAFAAVAVMLVHRTFATGHPPMRNMYGFLICTAAAIPVLTFAGAKADGEMNLLVDSALLALATVPVGFFMDGSPRHLPPALQSPYFIPHVGAYVLGYLFLVRAALGAGRRFAGPGFFMTTLGLVLGASWGKACWGEWWQFDPKEMWALAAWLAYAAYFHARPFLSPAAERVFLAVAAVLAILTLTWANMSRIFTGVHSYA